jgi:hypothetical protein
MLGSDGRAGLVEHQRSANNLPGLELGQDEARAVFSDPFAALVLPYAEEAVAEDDPGPRFRDRCHSEGLGGSGWTVGVKQAAKDRRFVVGVGVLGGDSGHFANEVVRQDRSLEHCVGAAAQAVECVDGHHDEPGATLKGDEGGFGQCRLLDVGWSKLEFF